jgi:foldase protein PrsA
VKSKQLSLVIAGLILLNCLTVAFFLSKEKATSGASLKKEVVATIGTSTISRQVWLSELEARYGKDVLKDMIDQSVIKEMAAKYHIKVSDQDVDREFRMMETTESDNSQNNQASEKKWKQQIRNSLLLEEILTKDVVVPEQQLKNYYAKNKNLFNVPTAYHLSHIIVKTKSEANQVLKELKHGSSFSVLAMERSNDEFSANAGGDIGYISDDEQYPMEYIQAAKELTKGAWSKPIKVEQGYAVLELEGKITGEEYSFTDVKEQLRRQIALEQMKIPENARSFWNEAKVKWFYGDENAN